MNILLEMSLAGALLVLVIILVRALVMHKLPKTTLLILWAIVLVRLLVPFSIPSQISVFNLTGMSNGHVAELHIPEIYEAPPTMPLAPAPIWQFQNTVTPGTNATAVASETVSLPGNQGLPAINPIMLVYFVGLILSTIFFTVLYAKHYKEFMTSLPVNNLFVTQWLSAHKLKRRIRIRVSDKVTTPLTYGVLRPVILMPKDTDWTNDSQLKYILAHEYIHIRRFDALTKIIMTAALCIHWFNPMLWAMYFLFNRDMEITCDEAVIRMFGETSKKGYALTLINMIERRSYSPVLYNNFSKHAIEERITAIMKIKKATLISTMVALAIIITTAAVFATNGVDSHTPVYLAPSGSNPSHNNENTPLTAPESTRAYDVEVVTIDDAYDFDPGTPGPNDLTAEAAAAIGADALKALFGANLSGTTISMSFEGRVEAASGRGQDTSWHSNLLDRWGTQLGMTVDEILDYVRERSERDYTFEVGLDVDSLASVVELTSDEFMHVVMMVYIQQRSYAAAQRWAYDLGMTLDELLEYMMLTGNMEDKANTVGVEVDQFVHTLGSVWNVAVTNWESRTRPGMWHGTITPAGSYWAMYFFTVNAETGAFIGANYSPWAIDTVGMPMGGLSFSAAMQAHDSSDMPELTAQHNNDYAILAMDIAHETNILDGAVARAKISTIASGRNQATSEQTMEIVVAVQCANGMTVIMVFDWSLQGQSTLIATSVQEAGWEPWDQFGFEWVAR
ncbi:MAG: M56 family metallopeptidase [Defluviitaleaceae bacterium]|nr:M56 family metallopeptidase [Defluviitaleaceae bacterium]